MYGARRADREISFRVFYKESRYARFEQYREAWHLLRAE